MNGNGKKVKTEKSKETHNNDKSQIAHKLKQQERKKKQPKFYAKKPVWPEKWTVAHLNGKKKLYDIVECLWSISDERKSARARTLDPIPSGKIEFQFSAATHSLTLRSKPASYQFIILLFNSIFVLIPYRFVARSAARSRHIPSAECIKLPLISNFEFCLHATRSIFGVFMFSFFIHRCFADFGSNCSIARFIIGQVGRRSHAFHILVLLSVQIIE